MIKKLKSFFKKLFSKKFVHPVVNEKLSNAIDDKISKRIEKQNDLAKDYEIVLNGIVKTYVSKQYESVDTMKVAFDLSNKEWNKICKEVNGKSKLINLNKNAFKNKVEFVIKTLKDGTSKK